MKLVREYLFEKFEEKSDPIADLGIGVGTYETLSSGAILQAKKFTPIGRKSGKITSWEKGHRIYTGYYILVINVKKQDKDRFLDVVRFFKLKDAKEFKKHLPWTYVKDINKVFNGCVINLKKQSFNNHFDIIERGI